MAGKSRFTRLDAFAKTVEDARIRTRSGGVVTIAALLIVIYLVWGEWNDYRRVVIQPELIVDKGRGERMEIHLNMTFPRLPCELLTLDVMDVSGELQTDVDHGVNKVRLSSLAEGGRVIDVTALDLHKKDDSPAHLDPDYCGDCYGVPAPSKAKKPGCCNTCDEVRDAYAEKNWAFGRGEGVKQCMDEGYSQRIDEQRNEGCRIEGILRVNKVAGNFHVAPGRSLTSGNFHAHDLDNYYHTTVPHTMTHIIHKLRFGPQLPEELYSRWKWTDQDVTNPLDKTEHKTEEPRYNFLYFVKVVSTSYLPLGWDASWSSEAHAQFHDQVPLGEQGKYFGSQGSIETHQYSVTSHKRSLDAGDDSAEGHKERQFARGGIPSVMFNYEISPMKVINRETRPKSLSTFLTGICAVIGGTLTVAAAVDRLLYEGGLRVKKLHKS
ncbi:endoplasmic reticulum-Golgi intermediate compartment protein 3 [Arthroderma uncinatum]|uniref:endoplasmic reticulum-Golgi intermediate compartment protein 3 n=1 Tax=Arthroderma uncinatum TaxID=74035 RepID=UPI00144AB902|nr:endoplasmic reticulum-Golgi intermediate compartment protein 3 [Arthroderma uncinatum]KAF3484196.1 endoplasmic reticulum-Golgi intermediate compartment protein 3 [Arthroderma uncinatum]